MHNPATLRPEAFVSLIVFVCMMGLYALNYNPVLLSVNQRVGASWVLDGGSKIPIASPHGKPVTVVNKQPAGGTASVAWSVVGARKTTFTKALETSAVAQRELIKGVPWAFGGSKVPAFGFVRNIDTTGQ